MEGTTTFGGSGCSQVFPQTSNFSFLSHQYLIQHGKEGWECSLQKEGRLLPQPMGGLHSFQPFLAGIFQAASHSVLGFSRIPSVNPELHLIPSLSERCIRSYSRALSFLPQKPCRTILGSLKGAGSFINSFMIDLALNKPVRRCSLV